MTDNETEVTQTAPVADATDATPPTGNVQDTPVPDAGTQDDTPPAAPVADPRDEKIAQLTTDVKTLNQAVIDSRRSNTQKPKGSEDESPFDSPEGQYGVALELAEGKIRAGLEKIISLYPEVSSEDIARIRANPLAFASRDSLLQGDHETALLEIEQSLLERAEAIAAAKGKETTPAPSADDKTSPVPANINSNPAPEPAGPPAVPGTEGDEDPWTMPLEKLEVLANQEVLKKTQKS